MNTLNVGQNLTLIAGLRIENEDNDYNAAYMTRRAQRISSSSLMFLTILPHPHIRNVLLPNLNISYRPFEFMNLRIACI